MIMKDFDVCLVGSDAQTGRKASDSQDRKLNSTHSLLLCKGASQQLSITTTIFCLANKREILWMHSRSEQWQLAGNQRCRWVDWRLPAKVHNWKHSKFLGTTQSRDPTTKSYWTSTWRHARGFSDSNDPNGILCQGVPNEKLHESPTMLWSRAFKKW